MNRSADRQTGAETLELPESRCIHQLLEEQAARNANAIAIAAPGRGVLTYESLCMQVRKVAGELQAAGVGPGDRIALVLPDGPEMVVALLAATSCGTGAPLNPAYRVGEIASYLSNLDAKAVIVQAGTDSSANAVAGANGIPVLKLSPLPEAPAGIFELAVDQALQPARAGAVQPGDTALIVHTSGTTARPKLVPLTHLNLRASDRNMRQALRLGSGDRYLSVMPLFHTHGILRTLSTLLSGGSVVCTSGFDVTRFFTWLDQFRPTWYSASPTIHEAIVRQAEIERETIGRRRLRLIGTSSSLLTRRLHTGLESLFNAPVVEIYGCAETLPCTYTPLPPRKRKVGSVGVPVGAEVAIVDESGGLLPQGKLGEVVVRGPTVMRGYLDDPAANEKVFINGWFRMGDLGYFDADGHLFLTGRMKDLINRGGEKISPGEIDEVILSHPAVAQVAAFAAPHPTLGEDVAAAVVLRENCLATEAGIRRFASAHLAEFKVPRQVFFVQEIPKGPTGKLRRSFLAEKLGLNQAARAVREAPRSEIERDLVEIWRQILGVEQVGIRDNFFDLGGNSLLATQVVARLGRFLPGGAPGIPLRLYFEAATIAELGAVIAQMRVLGEVKKDVSSILAEVEGLSDEEAST